MLVATVEADEQLSGNVRGLARRSLGVRRGRRRDRRGQDEDGCGEQLSHGPQMAGRRNADGRRTSAGLALNTAWRKKFLLARVYRPCILAKRWRRISARSMRATCGRP